MGTLDDPVLTAVTGTIGAPPEWVRAPGFPTLVLLVLEQAVSLASGRACYERVAALAPVTPPGLLSVDDAALREAGVSRQKAAALQGIARACVDGFDLTAPDRAALLSLPGVGPWTADCYLLFALRQPDMWPVGDIALQQSAAEILGLAARPTAEELEVIGERWRPERSYAARVLWHSYLTRRGRS